MKNESTVKIINIILGAVAVLVLVLLVLLGLMGYRYVSGGSSTEVAAEQNILAAQSEVEDSAEAMPADSMVEGGSNANDLAELEPREAEANKQLSETAAQENTDVVVVSAESAGEAVAVKEDSVEVVADSGAIASEAEAAEEVDPNEPRIINAPYTIYKNTISRGWENRSWDANVNFNGFPAYDGLTAMTINFTKSDGAVYLYVPEAINLTNYNVLRFWINGGTAGGQQLSVSLVDGDENILKSVPLTPPYANNWRQIDLLVEEMGDPSSMHGLIFQDALGEPQPVLFIDEVALVDDPLSERFGNNEINGPELTVDFGDVRHDISPYIYGMNWAPESIARELDLPLNRWGGNAVTRYNYLVDTSNTGNNWYFENIPPNDPDPRLPVGSSADEFHQANIRTGTESLMTAPLTGWVADGEYGCGFSVEKYGDQVETDEEWRPDCGAGVLVDGTVIPEGDPRDTSIEIGPDFIQNWIRHLHSQFGKADDEDGIMFWDLDNEPMIWTHTHRDIRSEPLGMDEFWEISVAYAKAIRDVDPAAQILGPVTWGWSTWFWSDVDIDDVNDPLVTAPDREAHDNLPLTAWYLQQFKEYDDTHGVRLLDYLDLHFYPQAVGVAFSEAGDEATQALRLRSTRSLWDPSYVDESWINTPVMMVPRMDDWIAEFYPGTLKAISEYNWGGLEHINGALAQADVLGILGREDVHLAALWGPPDDRKAPGYNAFRMFLNYDGLHSKFGDRSVFAESLNQDQIAIYAAERAEDGAQTVIIINKSNIPLTSQLNLDQFKGSEDYEAFRYSVANLGAIERLATSPLEGDELVHTYPPSSITLFVFQGE